ncbi:hypothetical protein [Streptomyces werraensis]|uniref:hypothetical protein n=1 Tax=Streptomyces werraensis TaxID=68284 RepID=UPI003702DB5D
MSYYGKTYSQGNGIEVGVYASPGGTIVFDLTGIGSHSRSAFSSKKLFQNLTADEARKLRKVLKHAIAEVEK